MPGRLFLTHDASKLGTTFGVPCALELSPRHNIQPGQEIPVLTETGWRMMRWGIIPVGRVNARGRPVMETIINARSETVFEKSAFDGVARGIVPATGWYEWTGEKRRKTAWAFNRKDGYPLAIAAIWDTWSGPGNIELAQVATLTCEPNADVAPIHHRMGTFLAPDIIPNWLAGEPVPLEPLEQGVLELKAAEDVDWSGA